MCKDENFYGRTGAKSKFEESHRLDTLNSSEMFGKFAIRCSDYDRRKICDRFYQLSCFRRIRQLRIL